MKKHFFIVSALVLVALSAMFVACEAKDGCTCTYQGETQHITLAQMKQYAGEKTCAGLQRYYIDHGMSGTKCK
ncbi:MAG: hypothetical protein IKN91_08045 [Paludibacteraceae bacterium]|nr:hypothetical protein [Paludibacteraceae bacterium]